MKMAFQLNSNEEKGQSSKTLMIVTMKRAIQLKCKEIQNQNLKYLN